MRWRLAALGATLAIVAGSGVAYVVMSHDVAPSLAPRPSPSPTATPTRSPALGALASDASLPTPQAVARRLRRAAAAPELGGALGAYVLDAATGQPLFVRRPDLAQPPASTAKLLTAVAALETLGPGATLSTDVVRSGRTLFLVGGGDVTLAAAARDIYPRPATLGELAARTASTVGGTRFRVRYDTSAWKGPPTATGWRPTYVTEGDVAPVSPLEVDEGRLTGFTSAKPQPRAADPAHAAAVAFQRALTSAGVRVTGPVSPGRAPTRRPVASVASPPVSALVQRMLTDSDNDLAEALARATAAHDGLPPTFPGAARAVVAGLGRAGLPTARIRLFDGSGLSPLDRVTPRLLAAVLRLVGARPELSAIGSGLPVAGFTGTLTDRYRAAPSRGGAGVVRAKTGTLAGVNALAGTVVDADGRLLVFAFLTDRATDPTRTEPALDRLAAELAGCDCR